MTLDEQLAHRFEELDVPKSIAYEPIFLEGMNRLLSGNAILLILTDPDTHQAVHVEFRSKTDEPWGA